MTDAETGGRRPHSKRRESEPRGARSAGNSSILRLPRQSNVQFPAEISIAVSVFGICPIRRSYAATLPNRGDEEDRTGGEPKSAFGPDLLPPVPALLLDGCLETSLPDAAFKTVQVPSSDLDAAMV